MNDASLYYTDILIWSESQAALVRDLAHARPPVSNELDIDHIAEEIEDVGRTELAAVRSYIRQILVHLIKAASVPDEQLVRHWRQEAGGFHDDMLDRLIPGFGRSDSWGWR